LADRQRIFQSETSAGRVFLCAIIAIDFMVFNHYTDCQEKREPTEREKMFFPANL
jgi:hypothetical protein